MVELTVELCRDHDSQMVELRLLRYSHIGSLKRLSE